MGLLRTIVHDNQITVDDLPRIEAKLFFEGEKRRLSIESFGVLMFFATIIATYGVIADSTATVIGAMIVAPLMTPIMATAAALVMGRMDRAGRSLLLVAGGVAGAIFLSWLLGSVYQTGIISISTNSQIVARTSPRLVDLYAALASGAVGAFAISREDVSDTLPGVAIAIALVPPLAVVGITLSQGEMDAARGAMLLFMTNFLSILLAGGGVLAVLGLGKAATKELSGKSRRNAFRIIAIGTLIVTIPLAVTSFSAARAGFAQYNAREATLAWLVGSDYDLINVDATADLVTIRIAGNGPLPPREELIAEMNARFSREIIASLDVVPSSSDQFVVTPIEEAESQ